jgi:hypothetical protein
MIIENITISFRHLSYPLMDLWRNTLLVADTTHQGDYIRSGRKQIV